MLYWKISYCKQLARCSLLSSLIFTWGIPSTDSVGRMEGDPEIIKSMLLPYHHKIRPVPGAKEIDLTLDMIAASLQELQDQKLITWYQVDENRYLFYPNFGTYQKLRSDRTYKSMYPEPPDSDEQERAPGEHVRSPEDPSEEENIPYEEIINYLNLKTSTQYKTTSRDTRDHIRARWREKHTLKDFKAVIDKKVAEWDRPPGPDGKDTRAWIRPRTLFGPKFESYLNQKASGKAPSSTKNFNERQYTDEEYNSLYENTGK
jgi:uncharacterized phage protein (TIGR02220 family)